MPVDLVVDHSVQVDFFGPADALRLNLEIGFQRNRERYQFLKWGQQAFKTFGVVPPGIGIVHQVNLEYLAKGTYYNAKEQRLLIDRPLGTIVVAGPKTLKFNEHFSKHRATLMKADGTRNSWQRGTQR